MYFPIKLADSLEMPPTALLSHCKTVPCKDVNNWAHGHHYHLIMCDKDDNRRHHKHQPLTSLDDDDDDDDVGNTVPALPWLPISSSSSVAAERMLKTVAVAEAKEDEDASGLGLVTLPGLLMSSLCCRRCASRTAHISAKTPSLSLAN